LFFGAGESLLRSATKRKSGGSRRAFCEPVSIKSMPYGSISIGIAENDETVSTINVTSGYLARGSIFGGGFITPLKSRYEWRHGIDFSGGKL